MMIQRSPVIREGSLRFDDDLERGGGGEGGRGKRSFQNRKL